MSHPRTSPDSWPADPPLALIDPGLLERVVGGLRHPGWVVVPDALPAGVAEGLLALGADADNGWFVPAGVGRHGHHRDRTEIRGDRIAWLDPVTAPLAESPAAWYFAWLESLRIGLNRGLFLGLFDVETHLAWYPPGAHYATHLDAFGLPDGSGTNRVVSLILYLNPDWDDGDGGELVVYEPSELAAPGTTVAFVEPRLGTLVLFLSDEFPHEVLPTTTHRMSLTGWFRDRPDIPLAAVPALQSSPQLRGTSSK